MDLEQIEGKDPKKFNMKEWSDRRQQPAKQLIMGGLHRPASQFVVKEWDVSEQAWLVNLGEKRGQHVLFWLHLTLFGARKGGTLCLIINTVRILDQRLFLQEVRSMPIEVCTQVAWGWERVKTTCICTCRGTVLIHHSAWELILPSYSSVNCSDPFIRSPSFIWFKLSNDLSWDSQ